MIARFRVVGRYGKGGRVTPATVEIDRDTNTVQIRPFRRRMRYSGTLDALAEVLVHREMMRIAAEKRAARRRRA